MIENRIGKSFLFIVIVSTLQISAFGINWDWRGYVPFLNKAKPQAQEVVVRDASPTKSGDNNEQVIYTNINANSNDRVIFPKPIVRKNSQEIINDALKKLPSNLILGEEGQKNTIEGGKGGSSNQEKAQKIGEKLESLESKALEKVPAGSRAAASIKKLFSNKKFLGGIMLAGAFGIAYLLQDYLPGVPEDVIEMLKRGFSTVSDYAQYAGKGALDFFVGLKGFSYWLLDSIRSGDFYAKTINLTSKLSDLSGRAMSKARELYGDYVIDGVHNLTGHKLPGFWEQQVNRTIRKISNFY